MEMPSCGALAGRGDVVVEGRTDQLADLENRARGASVPSSPYTKTNLIISKDAFVVNGVSIYRSRRLNEARPL